MMSGLKMHSTPHPLPLIGDRGERRRRETLIAYRSCRGDAGRMLDSGVRRLRGHASPRYESPAPSFDDLGETFERGEVLGPETHAQMLSLDDSTIRVAPAQRAKPGGFRHRRGGVVRNRRRASLDIHPQMSLPLQGGREVNSDLKPSPLLRGTGWRAARGQTQRYSTIRHRQDHRCCLVFSYAPHLESTHSGYSLTTRQNTSIFA